MKRPTWIAVAAVTLLTALPATAAGATTAVETAARDSVVGVSSGDRVGAGVAWASDRILTSSRLLGDSSSARVITRAGRVFDAEVEYQSDGLAMLSVDNAKLRAVRVARRAGVNGFVVGSPVGSRTAIGAVQISSRGGQLTVTGDLPGGTTGAPVLDDRGRLTGLITQRAATQARAANPATVRRFARAASSSGDGFPWLPVAAALLVVLLVALVLTALIRRRRAASRDRAAVRAQARAARAATPPPPPAPAAATAPPPPPPPPGADAGQQRPPRGDQAQTVVQPREPEPADDDFEIVFRSRDDEERR